MRILDRRDGLMLHRKTCIYAVLGVCAAILLYMLRAGAYPLLFSDEFYFSEIYADALNKEIIWHRFWNVREDHFYVFLKMWFWLVVYLGLDWRVTMHLQVLLLVFTACAMVKYKYGMVEKPIGYFCCAVSILVFLSPRQWENIYWALQMSAALMLCFSIMAFIFVDLFAKNKKVRFLVGSVIFAILSIFSNGGGKITLAVVLIMLFISFFERLKYYIDFHFMKISLLSAVAFIAAMCILKNVEFSETIGYLLAFLANSVQDFSWDGNDALTKILGALIMALMISVLYKGDFWKKNNFFELSILLFGVISALAICYTRLGNGMYQAVASRYYNFSSMTVIGVIFLMDRNENWNIFAKYSSYFLMGIVIFSYSKSAVFEMKSAPNKKIFMRYSHEKLCSGEDISGIYGGDKKYTDLNVVREIFCQEKQPE